MAHLTHIGHATVQIELDGLRLLTDPVLRRQVAHLRRFGRDVSPEVWTDVDAVLISHLHRDHLDLPSLRLIGRETPLIVPIGAGNFLYRRGFRRVREIRIGEIIRIGGIEIEATFAAHDGYRPPIGPRTPCVGYLIRHEKTIYFAGDTDIFPAMRSLTTELDVALLPVWGWGPTLGPGHMTPYTAAKALQLLQPRVAIPIHWGTFHPLGMGWLQPDFLVSPPWQFARHAREMAPKTDIQIVAPGQSFAWPD